MTTKAELDAMSKEHEEGWGMDPTKVEPVEVADAGSVVKDTLKGTAATVKGWFDGKKKPAAAPAGAAAADGSAESGQGEAEKPAEKMEQKNKDAIDKKLAAVGA